MKTVNITESVKSKKLKNSTKSIAKPKEKAGAVKEKPSQSTKQSKSNKSIDHQKSADKKEKKMLIFRYC